MKKFILLILTLCLLSFCLPAPTSADTGFLGGLSGTGALTSLNLTTSPQSIAITVIKAILSLVGIIFLALLIYGGAMYMFSQGAEDKIKKAKGILTSSIIGIIIIISGYTITYYITSQVESPGSSKPAFNEECENPESMNFYSLNCCEYRVLALGVIDDKCCDSTPFCCAHPTQCQVHGRICTGC